MVYEIVLALLIYDCIKFVLTVFGNVIFKKKIEEYKKEQKKSWAERIEELRAEKSPK